MNCQRCDYPLFHLNARACPECGEPFAVEWYRFEPNSVAFQCPHCAQEYFGNDEYGLPFPRDFDCVQCGQPVSLNMMQVVPKVEGAAGRLAAGSPWDERARIGAFSAWWQTWTLILTKPRDFFQNHLGTSWGEAYKFAFFACLIGLFTNCIFQALLMMGMGTLAGGGAGAGLAFAAPVYLCMGLVLPVITPAMGGAVSACFIHPAVALLAPRRRRFEDTMRVCMYGMAPYALYAIPVCGGMIGGLWAMWSTIAGIQVVHRTTRGRAAFAVLWPVFFVIAVYALIITFILAGRGTVVFPAPGGVPVPVPSSP